MSIYAFCMQVLWMQAELKAAKQAHLLTWQPWVGLPLTFCASYCHLQPPVVSFEQRVHTPKRCHEHGSHKLSYVTPAPHQTQRTACRLKQQSHCHSWQPCLAHAHSCLTCLTADWSTSSLQGLQPTMRQAGSRTFGQPGPLALCSLEAVGDLARRLDSPPAGATQG